MTNVNSHGRRDRVNGIGEHQPSTNSKNSQRATVLRCTLEGLFSIDFFLFKVVSLPVAAIASAKEAHSFANFGLCGGLSGLQKCVRRGLAIRTALVD